MSALTFGPAAMKYDETLRTPSSRLQEAQDVGRKLQELRIAHGFTQSDVAARAGISRSTAVLIEQGDESRTLAQVLRYLHAIESPLTLAGLLRGESGAVRNMATNARTKRVRVRSSSARKANPGPASSSSDADKYDF